MTGILAYIGSNQFNLGDGNDTFTGSDQAEVVYGEDGADSLRGNGGNDVLDGGAGADTLDGGAGADTFMFNDGTDLIRDFANNADTVQITEALWGGGLTVAQMLSTFGYIVSGDAVLDFGVGDILTIEGVTNLTVLEDDIVLI